MAEVLITLGIIGIIAALTMPALITNYQKHQTVVQLRKVYSDLNNAVKLSEIDNGPMPDWTYPEKECYEYDCIAPFVEQYYLPYFQGAKIVKSSDMPDYKMLLNEDGSQLFAGIKLYLLLNNGVILAFFANIPNGYIWLLADINGQKGLNKMGRDVFVFDAYNFYGIGYKIKFWGALYQDNDILTTASPHGYGCYKTNNQKYRNFYCGRLIEVNGWKIPDNYPW